MYYTATKIQMKATLYWYKKPCGIWLDQWLKWSVKSFSEFLSQVQIRNLSFLCSMYKGWWIRYLSFLTTCTLLMKPVASILGIPQENIFANQLLFRSSGEFLGFDKNEPTSRSGGKAVAVQQIKKVQPAC